MEAGPLHRRFFKEGFCFLHDSTSVPCNEVNVAALCAGCSTYQRDDVFTVSFGQSILELLSELKNSFTLILTGESVQRVNEEPGDNAIIK